MKVLGLGLKYEKTDILEMEIADSIHVRNIFSLNESLLSYVIDQKESALTDALGKLKKNFNGAKLLISYPSGLGYMDCFIEEINAGEDLNALLQALPTKIYSHLVFDNKEDYYADAPLVIKQDGKLYVTATYLHKDYADIITRAAINNGFKYCEGESDAITISRLLKYNQITNICYIVEIGENITSLTSYHPDRGMFLIPITVGWGKILRNPDGIKKINQHIVIADINTHKIFNSEDIPDIYIFSEKYQDIIPSFQELSERIHTIKLPPEIQIQYGDNFVLSDYAGILGLSLKPLAERDNQKE